MLRLREWGQVRGEWELERGRERESWGWAQVNIEHIAEGWRRISGKAAAAAAAGTDPSPEEGSDSSTYKVFSPQVLTLKCMKRGRLKAR